MSGAGARAPQGPGQAAGEAFAALEWPGDVRDPAGAGMWWLAGLGLLALAVLWGWRRRQRPAPVPAAAAAPPPTALAELRGLELPTDAAALAAGFARVKELLRRHCRERLGLCAEVATSEELLARAPGAGGLAPCLQACDLVLFAAVRGDAEGLGRCRALALAWAEANPPEGAR